MKPPPAPKPKQTISPRVARAVLLLNAWAVLLILALGLAAAVRRDHQLNALILDSAQRYDVDPRLVSAVIWQESRYKPNVRGAAGEVGLMQLMPAAASEWAKAENLQGFQHEELFNPAMNIHAGTWYLSKALRHWSEKADPVPYALAQYNAGRSRALRWDKAAEDSTTSFLQHIDIASTREYIDRIRARYRMQSP